MPLPPLPLSRDRLRSPLLGRSPSPVPGAEYARSSVREAVRVLGCPCPLRPSLLSWPRGAPLVPPLLRAVEAFPSGAHLPFEGPSPRADRGVGRVRALLGPADQAAGRSELLPWPRCPAFPALSQSRAPPPSPEPLARRCLLGRALTSDARYAGNVIGPWGQSRAGSLFLFKSKT